MWKREGKILNNILNLGSMMINLDNVIYIGKVVRGDETYFQITFVGGSVQREFASSTTEGKALAYWWSAKVPPMTDGTEKATSSIGVF